MLLIDAEKSYVHVQGKVNAQAGSGTYDFLKKSEKSLFFKHVLVSKKFCRHGIGLKIDNCVAQILRR